MGYKLWDVIVIIETNKKSNSHITEESHELHIIWM